MDIPIIGETPDLLNKKGLVYKLVLELPLYFSYAMDSWKVDCLPLKCFAHGSTAKEAVDNLSGEVQKLVAEKLFSVAPKDIVAGEDMHPKQGETEECPDDAKPLPPSNVVRFPGGSDGVSG